MRLNVVDIIKGIAIIMIVNVHLIGGQFFSIGSSFHVITFFFASGLVHGMTQKWERMSINSFIKQKASRLLYPYLTLSICYICFHVILNIVRGQVTFDSVIIGSIIKTMSFKGIGTLWFLPVMFFGEIIFFAAKKKWLTNTFIIVVGFLAVFLSSYLNLKGVCGKQWYGINTQYGLCVNNPLTLLLASLIASMFIAVGYAVYRKLPNNFFTEVKTNKVILIIFFACIASFAIDLVSIHNYSGDLHKLDIGNPIIYLICSFSGILFVCTFSIIIERFLKYTSLLLQFFGKNSLIIMTTHTEYYINSIAYVALTVFFTMSCLPSCNEVLSGMSLLLIMVLEIAICYLVNHSFLKKLYDIPRKQQ